MKTPEEICREFLAVVGMEGSPWQAEPVKACAAINLGLALAFEYPEYAQWLYNNTKQTHSAKGAAMELIKEFPAETISSQEEQ